MVKYRKIDEKNVPFDLPLALDTVGTRSTPHEVVTSFLFLYPFWYCTEGFSARKFVHFSPVLECGFCSSLLSVLWIQVTDPGQVKGGHHSLLIMVKFRVTFVTRNLEFRTRFRADFHLRRSPLASACPLFASPLGTLPLRGGG